MSFARIARLVNTLRYLTPEQVLYRLYYRIRSLRVVPVENAALRSPMSWASPEFIQPSTDDGIEFSFLGMRGRVEGSAWNAAQHSKLWLYNLHYLDDLNAVGIDEQNALARALLNRWIEANPPPFGNGWEPYPLSLRIVNQVKWFARQKALEPQWLASLATQMQALAKQVEYHILGNHLFANGKALVFGGIYLAGPDAERWLAKGLKILDQEIKEQFLEDGAHFELSPMYHATLMWDMCDLVNLAERVDVSALKARLPEWRALVSRGLVWMHSMQHPDGGLSFFNDAAFGIAPTSAALDRYAAMLNCIAVSKEASGPGIVAVHHGASGYARVDMGQGHRLLLDMARVGPDYQPGHAHADTLSFELSLFGQRIFVNSGTSQYGEGIERQRQRSTAAHNTVEVDGENSSQVWAGFRVGRRAYPVVETFECCVEQARIRAFHNGYRRLGNDRRHTREWLIRPGSITLKDEVAQGARCAVARLYVHPDVHFEYREAALVARLPGGEAVEVIFEGATQVSIVASTWHPQFGARITNQCITAEFPAGLLCTSIAWSSAV